MSPTPPHRLAALLSLASPLLLLSANCPGVDAGSVKASPSLVRKCFHEPFPGSFELLCGTAGAHVELASPVEYYHSTHNVGAVARKRNRATGGSPWSHQPICTPRFDSIEASLCVYTSDTFADGRGISLLTTPEHGKILVEHPAFKKLQHSNSAGQDADTWYTEKISGRGIGMRAKKALKRGDVITAYPPMLLLHPAIEAVLNVNDRETLIRKAVSQLPVLTQNKFGSLSTSLNDPRIKAQDIIVTNAFEVALGNQTHIAMVPEAARINHDCAPNSIYNLHPDTLTHFVYAVTDIAEDEEITTTYSNPLVLSTLRRSNLANAFRFSCSCKRCEGVGVFRNSDDRVRHIHALADRLEDWEGKDAANYGTPPPAKPDDEIDEDADDEWDEDELGPPTPQMAEQLVRLYKREGQFAHLGDAYSLAAFSWSAVRNRKKALENCKLALEALEMANGPGGGPGGAAVTALKESLTLRGGAGHWSWGARIKKKEQPKKKSTYEE